MTIVYAKRARKAMPTLVPAATASALEDGGYKVKRWPDPFPAACDADIMTFSPVVVCCRIRTANKIGE